MAQKFLSDITLPSKAAGLAFLGPVSGSAAAPTWRAIQPADLPPNTLGTVTGFRLTLTSALPVTTSDVTAATILYCTSYTPNNAGSNSDTNTILNYTGTTWVAISTTEMQLPVTISQSCTTNTPD